jgi:hypothetical protein
MRNFVVFLVLFPLVVLGFGNFTTQKIDRIENNTESQITFGSPLQGDSLLQVNDRLQVNSTSEASRPCPEMTNTERDALTPATGDCIYSSTDSVYYYYNGTVWGEMGGGTDATINNGLVKYDTTTEKTKDTQLIEDVDGLLRTTATDYELLTVTDDSFLNKRFLDLNFQPLDGDLTGLSVLSGTGFVVRTAADTYTERSVTGTASEIEITNGAGTAGDVIVGIVDDPIFGGNGAIQVPSGTVAQRPVGVNGQIRYNSDDNIFEGFQDGDWGSLGGGLGSAQTITIVEADNDSTDFSGNNPIFDGGGSISGTITENTTASNFLTGEKKIYFYDASATPQDDFFGWTRNIPQGWRGRTIAYEFTYRTDAIYQDGDIVFQIKDNTNADLLINSGYSINQFSSADGNGETIRGLVNIPKDAASLDFGFQVVGPTASFDFFVDKISLDIDDFNYKNVTETQSVRYTDVNPGSYHGSINNKIPYFTTEVENDGANIVSIDNSSTLGFSITANKDCVVTANWYRQGDSAAKTAWTGWSLNSSQLTTSIQGITSSNRIALNAPHDDGGNSGFAAGVSVSIKLSAGDILRPHSDGVAEASALAGLSLTAKATSKHVVVDSGEADIENYKMSWTADFWDTTAPTQSFNTSLLPLTDSKLIEYNDTTETRIVAKQDCIVTVTIAGQLVNDSELDVKDSNGNLIVRNTARTDQTTSAGTSATVPIDAGDYITLSKGNSVNRTASISITAQKQTRGEYHLVPVSDQENVFSAKFSTTGVLTSQSSPFIESVSDEGNAVTRIDFKSGIFTEIPAYTVTVHGSNSKIVVGDTPSAAGDSASTVYIRTVTDAGSASNVGFDVTFQKQGSDYSEPKVFLGNVATDYTQTKYYSGTAGNNTVLVQFSNLTIGKMYRFDAQASMSGTTNGEGGAEIEHNGNVIGYVAFDSPTSASFGLVIAGTSATFKAVATTALLRANQPSGMIIFGDGSGRRTFGTLTELNNTKETSKF